MLQHLYSKDGHVWYEVPPHPQNEELYGDTVRILARPLPGLQAPEVVDEKDKYLPPDQGDICWHTGSETFTRKEVWYLLWTQRAMIENDLKNHCGNDLTEDMYRILKNPRKPKY